MDRRRTWTDAEVKYLRENYGKLTLQELADQLGKTVPAVSGKAGLLGFRGAKMPPWSEKECEYLRDNWGRLKFSILASRLNRTETAVLIKAKRLGLGPTKSGQGLLTARDLARALGVDIHAVTDFWIPQGLRAQRVVTRIEKEFWQIDIDDWWKWAKRNQDNFDSRRMEPLALGAEPGWMEKKRKSDRLLPHKRNRTWTSLDDDRLRHLLVNTELTYREIGQKLGRSERAVSRRIDRLNERKRVV